MQSKYQWPASQLSENDMALLHKARETSQRKTTISELLAVAVRRTFGVKKQHKAA